MALTFDTAGFNHSAVITISGGATWRIPNYSYAGMGQLADYRQRRVLDNGTIEVTANSHSSGQDFTVNAAGGMFRYTPAGQTLTLSGNSNTNIQFNGPLTFDTIGDISITGTSAILEGTGALVKTGGGTLILGNAGNSFSGNLTVNAGLLRATAFNGSATTSSLGAKNASRTVPLRPWPNACRQRHRRGSWRTGDGGVGGLRFELPVPRRNR